jgi:hypothetical protein
MEYVTMNLLNHVVKDPLPRLTELTELIELTELAELAELTDRLR